MTSISLQIKKIGQNFVLPRSVRLGVRTPGFHPGNRGSIPLRTTTKPLNLLINSILGGFFSTYCRYSCRKLLQYLISELSVQ